MFREEQNHCLPKSVPPTLPSWPPTMSQMFHGRIRKVPSMFALSFLQVILLLLPVIRRRRRW